MANIESFLKELTGRQNIKKDFDSDINVTCSTYIYNLLKSEEDATFCSLLYKKRKRGFFLWSINPSLHLPKGIAIDLNDIIKKVDSHKDCELCELINHVKLGSVLKLSNEEKDELLSMKEELQKNREKKRCGGCQDLMKKFICKYPNCLGFDGFIECKNKPIIGFEKPEPYFNATLIDFLCLILKKKKIKAFGIENVDIEENKTGKKYEYDIILFAEKKGIKTIFQIETKFGKNDNKTKQNFIKKHMIIKEKCQKDKNCNVNNFISIFFRPYKISIFLNDIKNNFKNMEKKYVSKNEKKFNCCLKNNEFIECSTKLLKKERIKFLKSMNNISSHIGKLIAIIFSKIS